jgi:hypothetical protein
MAASRTSKTGDTWEPVTGTARNGDGTPADLRGADLRFMGYADLEDGTTIFIDSNEDTPSHGICVNVEDESLDEADRGRYRFEQTVAAVSQDGLYKCELECTMPNGKIITFPSREVNNPEWQLDPDIDSKMVP